MIDSDELKRKLAVLNGLKRIKSYLIHKLYKYGDEFDKIIFDVEFNPNILNEERFLKNRISISSLNTFFATDYLKESELRKVTIINKRKVMRIKQTRFI